MSTEKENKLHLIDNEQGMNFSIQRVQPVCDGRKCLEEMVFLIENVTPDDLNDGDLHINLSREEAQKLMKALESLLDNTKNIFYRNIKGITYRYASNIKGYDIDVKLNDAFAQSVGCSDLGDLLSSENGIPFENLMNKFGCVPKYLPLQVNGEDSDIVREAKTILEWKQKNRF